MILLRYIHFILQKEHAWQMIFFRISLIYVLKKNISFVLNVSSNIWIQTSV